jgi:hypothetical protein
MRGKGMRQRMSMNTKRELLQIIRPEYLAADKERKSELLNSLIESTGYNRKYAISLLSQEPRTKDGKPRTRKSKYGGDVIDAVRQLWRAANGICAKRLLPFLPTLIEALERSGHMKLDKQVKANILRLSVSTLERMLKKERDKALRGKSFTRPGSPLQKQIAVKTFAEWDNQEAGFFEIDLVAHCGEDISGKFIHTLTMTDIATGWTEIMPLLHRADSHVRDGMEKVIELLPFKLKGIDCDNGSEFLNYRMVAWCKAREITFTRSRAYRKNDQAHVEEKNGSVVRRLVGYDRFEGRQALEIMTDLYSISRLYINYFQPSMKLIKKTRVGSKVTKQYDAARTPLQRLLASTTISKKEKATLLREFQALDPIKLLSTMARLQARLWHRTSKPAGESLSIQLTPAYPMLERAASKKGRRRASAGSGRNRAETIRVQITQEFVNQVAPPSSGQIIYRDSLLTGFGLRVTPGAKKSFISEGRVNGIVRRVTIGRANLFTADEARSEAARLRQQMDMGIEPLTLLKKRKK